MFIEFHGFASYFLHENRKIISTRQKRISASVSISEGIILTKKETNLGEWDICDIEWIISLKICENSQVDDLMILSCSGDHCAIFFTHAMFQGN